MAAHEACLAAYNKAIAEMKRVKWVHMEALANERAGFYLACPCIGDFVKAEHYFNTVMDLYKNKWGSIAKYEWLREKCGQTLKREGLPSNIILEGDEEDCYE
jgi:hypothetical protein